MGLILGLDAVTANNTGTTSAPVYVKMDNIRDEEITLESALADATTRKAQGWRLQLPTLSEGSVSAGMMYDTEDTEGFEVVRAAYFAKSRLLMGFFDDDPTQSGNVINGLVGGFGVTQFNIDRSLEEVMQAEVIFTVREDDEGNPPSWLSDNTVSATVQGANQPPGGGAPVPAGAPPAPRPK